MPKKQQSPPQRPQEAAGLRLRKKDEDDDEKEDEDNDDHHHNSHNNDDDDDDDDAKRPRRQRQRLRRRGSSSFLSTVVVMIGSILAFLLLVLVWSPPSSFITTTTIATTLSSSISNYLLTTSSSTTRRSGRNNNNNDIIILYENKNNKLSWQLQDDTNNDNPELRLMVCRTDDEASSSSSTTATIITECPQNQDCPTSTSTTTTSTTTMPLHLPLHVQVKTTTTTTGTSNDYTATTTTMIIWSPVWQSVPPAQPKQNNSLVVCADGTLPMAVWKTTLLSQSFVGTNQAKSTATTTITVMDWHWYAAVCVHGRYWVEPWTYQTNVDVVPDVKAQAAQTQRIAARRPAVPFNFTNTATTTRNLFAAHAAWIATASLPSTLLPKEVTLSNGKQKTLLNHQQLPPYLWLPTTAAIATTIDHSAAAASWEKLPRTTADALVYESAIIVPPEEEGDNNNNGGGGYGLFRDLGNYELLCFVGNATMAKLRNAFLQLRPQLFPQQRPFKFHFYDIADFQQPDRYWDTETKKRMRKCKHMLVLMEEFTPPLAQREYRNQLVNFVGHLLRLMNDETFPIRLLTWTESTDGSKQCHSPYLPWTNDHPCNNVLRELFSDDKSDIPPRVKLLDNADLTMPWLSDANLQAQMRPFVLAAIALRLYVIVGEQVALWRAVGQRGAIDGLHRNGKVEPNFELVPYTQWGEPLQQGSSTGKRNV